MALNQPLVDAHLLRQCQTADATKSLIEQGGFHLASRVPWLGDLDARYVLELPVFNYLVIGVWKVTGNLDLSGKVVSVLLWVASFLALQPVWRRLLKVEQIPWANLLFVFAPLEVFYGQAFMPEMLVQALSIAFVWFSFRYSENLSLSRWIPCACAGFAALIVKLPETCHLYLVLAFLLMRSEGWRGLFKPRYLIAAVVTMVCLKVWGNHVDSVNGAYLPEWTSKQTLSGFIGRPADRLNLKIWLRLAFYLTAFAAPGPLMLVVAGGLWIFLKKQKEFILGVWLIVLLGSYVLWFGNGGAHQSYYNLPAMVPMCALFAIGVAAALDRIRQASQRHVIAIAFGLVTVTASIPGTLYLFQPDRQILAASIAMRHVSKPDDLVLFRPDHRGDMIDYPYNPVLAYYSNRKTFVWTANTPGKYREAALERARYAIVTLPAPVPTGYRAWVHRLSPNAERKPENTDWLLADGFRPITREAGFVIYSRD